MKPGTLKLILGLCAVASSACVSAVRDSPTVHDVAGVYERCPFHCETITLSPNGRFVAVLDGDLFNNETASGKWRIHNDTEILLTTDQQPRVLESQSGIEGAIRFKVLDQEEEPLSVTGYLDCPEPTEQWYYLEGELIAPDPPGRQVFTLGSNDFIYVTNCSPTRFFLHLYSVHNLEYSPSSLHTDTFVFFLDTTTDFYLEDARCRFRKFWPVDSGNCGRF